MIPRWLLKALAQGVISHLPRQDWINIQFQKRVTKSIIPSQKALARRLKWCAEHLVYYRRNAESDSLPETVLELGTGWFPTVPIGMYLCGVRKVYSIDIRRLSDPAYFDAMLRILSEYPHEELKAILPDLQDERFAALKQIANTAKSQHEALEQMQIELLIADARHTDFPDASVDYVISNTTLEHIPYPILVELFQEFHRILKPDGLMSHIIDMSDHYQHFDHSITGYNFLRYNDFVWSLLNNPLQYQNRLREPDYRNLHATTGFRIVEQENRSGSVDELKHIKLAKRFDAYSQDEILVKSARMISTPMEKTTVTSTTVRDTHV
ncbi:MAG TPA: methyltransferase domain-containing protein [Oceanobacillus sp.]|nr:methyltransferase domain-containing protein [Oceanobacillus sp.]